MLALRSLRSRAPVNRAFWVPPSTVQQLHRCLFSGKATPNDSRNKLRNVSPLFASFIVVGIGLSAYAGKHLYDVSKMWPPEVRRHLRKGLYQKHTGNYKKAAIHLNAAWMAANGLPPDAFGDEPYLKTTGIAIALAEVMEKIPDMDPELPYDVYNDAFVRMIGDGPTLADRLKDLSNAERLRAAAIAYKAAELAHDLQKPPVNEQQWLILSVEILMATWASMKDLHATSTKTKSSHDPMAIGQDVAKSMIELGLPEWAKEYDLIAPFERLGSFYARAGDVESARKLYEMTIFHLLSNHRSSASDKCRGAQLMGNMSDLLLRNHASDNIPPEVLDQATAYAEKGLSIAETLQKRTHRKNQECNEACAVQLFNVARLKEFAGKVDEARTLFQRSLDQGKAIGMEVCVTNAQEALDALRSTS